MDKTLEQVCTELDVVAQQIKATFGNDKPLAIAHGNNWSFPAVSKTDLASVATDLARRIREAEIDELEDDETEGQMIEVVEKLTFLRTHTIPNVWSNPNPGVAVYLETMRSVERVINPLLGVVPPTEELSTSIKKLRRQIAGMEARTIALQPRTDALDTLVSKLEAAGESADQLPTDLEELAQARRDIARIRSEADGDLALITKSKGDVDTLSQKISQHEALAKSVLERSERAYSAATSQGLASAFSERSRSLNSSMWIWTVGLIVSLFLGFHFGTDQIKALNDVVRTPNVAPSLVLVSAILAVLSVGAPVWFAWLSTKQVSQSFRLAEDYAFKAAVSRAYEGYRREAARVDEATETTDMEARLLGSALTRFDEQPLRVVDPSTPGSPWHELMASDAVRSALRVVPHFVDSVKDMAVKAVARNDASKLPSRTKDSESA